MTYPVFTNGTVLPASDLNAIGLWLVKSQTIGSGVSSVTLTSCFSSDYDNYLISWSGVTCSAAGVFVGATCVGSTPTASGWYGNTYYVANGALAGLSAANDSNTAFFAMGSTSTTYTNSGQCALQSPYLASETRSQYTNADNNYWRFGAAQLANTTQYDGLKFYPLSGTMTGGTIRVYGYRN